MKRTLALLLLAAPLCAGAEIAVLAEPGHPGPGEAFAVRVTGAGNRPLQAEVDGHAFPLWEAGEGVWEGIAAVDRDAEVRELSVAIVEAGKPDATLTSVPLALASREYAEQHLNVSESMVTLSPEDQARAARERKRIGETLALRSPEKLWSTGFARPVEGPTSSAFGVRRFYNGKRRGYHSGLDLAAPLGTPVRASSSGRVALVGDFFYTGKTVFLDHGLGLLTAYFHMDSVSVGEGTEVRGGDEIGRVGSTGRSTGAHLHWGVYVSGIKADPESLVRVTALPAGGGEP